MGNLGLLMLYVLAFIAIFYFLAIRPQQRQRRTHDALVSGLKRGDRIVTAGGIYGTIKRVEPDAIVVEVAKGVDITMARRAVAEVIDGGAGAAARQAKEITPPAEETEPLEETEPPAGQDESAVPADVLPEDAGAEDDKAR